MLVCVVFSPMVAGPFKSFSPIEEDGLQVVQDQLVAYPVNNVIISSTVWNIWSLTFCFNIPNNQKSHGLRSGEQGGWGMRSNFRLTSSLVTLRPLWHTELSRCTIILLCELCWKVSFLLQKDWVEYYLWIILEWIMHHMVMYPLRSDSQCRRKSST
jgi:hypothetical protein